MFFEDLMIGERFSTKESPQKLFMKTNPVFDESIGEEINSVNLDSGFLSSFDYLDKVERFDQTL